MELYCCFPLSLSIIKSNCKLNLAGDPLLGHSDSAGSGVHQPVTALISHCSPKNKIIRQTKMEGVSGVPRRAEGVPVRGIYARMRRQGATAWPLAVWESQRGKLAGCLRAFTVRTPSNGSGGGPHTPQLMIKHQGRHNVAVDRENGRGGADGGRAYLCIWRRFSFYVFSMGGLYISLPVTKVWYLKCRWFWCGCRKQAIQERGSSQRWRYRWGIVYPPPEKLQGTDLRCKLAQPQVGQV